MLRSVIFIFGLFHFSWVKIFFFSNSGVRGGNVDILTSFKIYLFFILFGEIPGFPGNYQVYLSWLWFELIPDRLLREVLSLIFCYPFLWTILIFIFQLVLWISVLFYLHRAGGEVFCESCGLRLWAETGPSQAGQVCGWKKPSNTEAVREVLWSCVCLAVVWRWRSSTLVREDSGVVDAVVITNLLSFGKKLMMMMEEVSISENILSLQH